MGIWEIVVLIQAAAILILIFGLVSLKEAVIALQKRVLKNGELEQKSLEADIMFGTTVNSFMVDTQHRLRKLERNAYE